MSKSIKAKKKIKWHEMLSPTGKRGDNRHGSKSRRLNESPLLKLQPLLWNWACQFEPALGTRATAQRPCSKVATNSSTNSLLIGVDCPVVDVDSRPFGYCPSLAAIVALWSHSSYVQCNSVPHSSALWVFLSINSSNFSILQLFNSEMLRIWRSLVGLLFIKLSSLIRFPRLAK